MWSHQLRRVHMLQQHLQNPVHVYPASCLAMLPQRQLSNSSNWLPCCRCSSSSSRVEGRLVLVQAATISRRKHLQRSSCSNSSCSLCAAQCQL